VKEEPIHRTKSHFQDIGGDEAFPHDGLTGKILYRAHTLDSARFAAAPWINLLGSDSPGCSSPDGKVRPAMQDVTMLLFTVVFFGLAFLYVKACQKLR
jgi:hypothetical protein